MILLIAGSSHTGKTLLAQRLLEETHWPYFSIDHLKMGLIRSGQTKLTPGDDGELTEYLWPIVREMVKTAIENGQNMIVEGCYIPFDWKKDFAPEYLEQIQCRWLVMTREYIAAHGEEILRHADDIENRREEGPDLAWLARDNAANYEGCRANGCEMIIIDGDYKVEWEWKGNK